MNALFDETGFRLIPWRFRDLWYPVYWRFTSDKRFDRERKLYGLRVLAGSHRSWHRLPGAHTLDELIYAEYECSLSIDDVYATFATFSAKTAADVALNGELDTRLPLPASKSPDYPLIGIRAPTTTAWKSDFLLQEPGS